VDTLGASMADPVDDVRAELTRLEAAGLRRRMRPIDGPQSAEVVVDGRRAINFSSNNYLGLADQPLLLEAAAAAMREDGFGAGASRLIVGNLAPHRALEARIARWKNTEAALVFNSGYQANVGLVSALAGPDDVVFSDELNHASLIDGCRLSRARIVVYRHGDSRDLASRLADVHGRRRLIVTDSVFSMDGDLAPLVELTALARQHDALLAVDEAHAVGVLGDRGVGLCAGLPVHLQMGTLGKALGGFGAYVAGPTPLIELLFNRARSFVFTTALPVPVVAAASAAIDWLATPDGGRARSRLDANVQRTHRALAELRFPVGERPSHIVPLGVKDGDPRRAMAACEALLARGLFAQGIRPPTVPEGTARLRLALMATHTDEHLTALFRALAELRELFA
jgi:8-amino-7-oxononanoate synthase